MAGVWRLKRAALARPLRRGELPARQDGFLGLSRPQAADASALCCSRPLRSGRLTAIVGWHEAVGPRQGVHATAGLRLLSPVPREGEQLAAAAATALPIGFAATSPWAPPSELAPSWTSRRPFLKGVSSARRRSFLRRWTGLRQYPDARSVALQKTAISALIANVGRQYGACLRLAHRPCHGADASFRIPDGAKASEGAYIAHPIERCAGAGRGESTRATALVGGEDLGTVAGRFP